MQERLKEIPKKFLEYWNKWTGRQKTIIVSAVAVVIILIAILVMVLGRTKYMELGTFEDTKTASQVLNLMKENAITTKLGSDNVTVMVDEEQYTDALMMFSLSDMVEDDFTLDDLLDNALTDTNKEFMTKSYYYVTKQIEATLKKYMPGVKDAIISFIPVDTSNSILTVNKTIPVSVTLVTEDDFDEDSAVGIAETVARAVGNPDTKEIRVVNHKGEILFNGPEEEKEEDIDLTDAMVLSDQMRKVYEDQVEGQMLMNNFTEVLAACNLSVNFDKAKELITTYYPLEGEIHGVMTEEHETSSSGENGYGDIPGTDSNDETDYMLVNSTDGTYETSTMDRFYTPSSSIKEIFYANGTIDKENSSISVTARKVIHYTEEELELLGRLDDMSFEEYVLLNSDPVRTVNQEALISAIAMATGIPEENISLVTYDIFEYTAKEEVARDWTFYLQILLAVILIAFLMFVVFRGIAPVEVTELEPELSVEQLLATTKENQSLEDVEFSEQSETRRMIEKFFEENPEAVALLLRNWLNEDWD